MYDRTDEFNQIVLLLKNNLSNRNLNIEKRRNKQLNSNANLKNLLYKIKDVVSAITKMKIFLIKNKKDYLNLYRLFEDSCNLNDVDRNRIDQTAENFIKNYTTIICQLKLECYSKTGLTFQIQQHCVAVINLVEDYLKFFCNIYNKQKKIRLKRTLDKNNVFRLESFVNKKETNVENKNIRLRKSKNELNDIDKKKLNDKTINKIVQEENQKILDSLEQEEIQMFDSENNQLFDNLNLITDEVKKIETQVVEIAQLQELFTEKVLQQEQDLNKVNLTVIGSTEDIKGGNEQLRKAMKKNAGFRFWIFFIIIILSFTILFLDWYNP